MFDTQNLKIAAAVSAAVACGAVTIGYLSSIANDKSKLLKAPKKWIRVGEVTKLTLYPVKSCHGIDVNEATASAMGLTVSGHLRDRVFVVVLPNGNFRTQRQLPRMALISVSIDDNQLTLSAPDRGPITIDIPDYQPGLVRPCRIFDNIVKESLDCGDQVGNWLSEFLEVPGLRLYYHHHDTSQRVMTPLQHRFPTFVKSDTGAYHDQTSFMMIPEESLAELNNHLNNPVSMRNFRPSIAIKGTPEPFAEDVWNYVRIGGQDGPIFKTAKPCTRCKLTTVNPEKGEFDDAGEPLATLHKLKRSYGNEEVDELCKNQAVLGIQMGLLQEGKTICVGDPVYAALL